MKQASDFRHLERLRVRWAEVDMQKIVFNGHYLMYFDTAVAGYWRALALPYHEVMEAWRGDMFLRKATVEYEAPAHYDDVCDVGVRCARIGTTSMVFEAALFRGPQRLVHGELVYVFADPVARASRPVPPPLRDWFEAYEAGAAMIEMRRGAWAELGGAAAALREAVFVRELGLPAVLSGDAEDEGAQHVLALNRLRMAVGTGRLLPDGPGRVRIGRLAVVASLRRSRVGVLLLEALVDAARESGAREVVLAAFEGTEPFYRRAGFEPLGARYEEAGIGHQEMLRAL